MILKLTLGTGETLEVPFDQTSALTVTTVTNVDGVQTEKAEAHADIVGIELVEGDLEPAQPEVTQLPPPSAQDVQVAISETTGQPAQETPDGALVGPGPSDLEGGDPTDVGPEGTPNPVVQTAEGITNDAGLTAEAPQVETTDTPPAEVPSHDEAVVNAQIAVDAAASGAPVDHVQRAIADIDAALAVYPDSVELQDAKQQLALFAGPQA